MTSPTLPSLDLPSAGWDLVELFRKLVLTALLLLITESTPMSSFVRISIALVTTIGYLVAIILARPYHESHGPSTLAIAIITNVSLCGVLLCILLLKLDAMDDTIDVSFQVTIRIPHRSPPYLSTRAPDPISPDLPSQVTIIMLCCTLGVLGLTVLLLIYVFGVELSNHGLTLRHRRTGELAQPPKLPNGLLYHLFLSHSWANQDAAAVIKRQLQLMLPGVQIFLDVDMQVGDRFRWILGASDASECV